MKLLDANIVVRSLTRDYPDRTAAARQLFLRVARGEEELLTNDLVIFEVIFILTSRRHYNLSRTAVRDRLFPLLSLSGLHLANRTRHFRALDIYASHPQLDDYADAYNRAQMGDEGIEEIISYDSGFDRVPGVRRLEP